MNGLTNFKKPKFSWVYLLIFGLIFATIGIYIVYRSLASDTIDMASGDLVLPANKSIERIYGRSRYDTAVGVSKKTFPNTGMTDTVVLTSGENWPDAAIGAPLAKSYNAPILLTTKASLSAETRGEIVRLKPKRVLIIGGTAAVSSTVETAVKTAAPGVIVERIIGADRYATSLAVASKIKSKNVIIADGTAIFVTGSNFPDALSVSSIAAAKKYPIIYLGTTISSSTRTIVRNLGITRSIVVGGTAVIPDTVKNVLPAPIRISGADRYQTSVKFADWSIRNIPGVNIANLGVATGADFPDALVSSVYISSLSTPGITVLSSYNIPSTVANFLSLKRSGINHIYVFGGSSVLSSTTYNILASYVGSVNITEQTRAQDLVNGFINLCPILAGTVVEMSTNTSGYQSIVYYKSGRILINPTHTATLDRIIAHEIYHVYDWRDNQVLNWGEYLPPTPKPVCMP